MPGLDTARAVKTALELAADRARVTAVGVIEVPADLPLDAEMPAEEAKVHALLAAATLQADARGLPLAARPLRAREAGKAIVDEASRQQADLTVLGPAEGRAPTKAKGPGGPRPDRRLRTEERHLPGRRDAATGGGSHLSLSK